MQVADKVAQVIESWNPDAVFIDGSGGYGAGVIDRLRQLRHRVTEVQFGGAATDERFANMRVAMWFRMAEWVIGGGAIPPSPGLKVDLCAPTYTHDTRGRMQLESKEAIKKRGMASPDEGDALALTFAYPVATRELTTAMQAQARKPFDPLARVRSGGK